MAGIIFITGSAKADCLRIKDVLRRRFRETVIHVDDGGIPDIKDSDVVVVAHSVDAFPATARASEELEQRIRRAEFLVEVTRLLASPHPSDDVLNEVTTNSTDVLGEIAFVVLAQDGALQLQCAASAHNDQLIPVLKDLINREPQTFEAAIQKLLQPRDPIVVSDVSTAVPSDEVHAFAARLPIQSMVAAPILKDGHVFGVFVSASDAGHGFDEPRVALARALGEAMGAALHTAKVVAQLEEKANTDALTNLYNARFFNDVLTREVALAERHKRQLS